jgi:hypothetical protein
MERIIQLSWYPQVLIILHSVTVSTCVLADSSPQRRSRLSCATYCRVSTGSWEPGTAVKPFMVGFSVAASPFAEVLFRKAGTGLDTGIAK